MKLLAIISLFGVFLPRTLCFNPIQNEIVQVLKDIRLPKEDDLCEHHISVWLNNLGNFTEDMWAQKMFDAWSKFPPAGILERNVGELGNFDECIKIDTEIEKTRVRGKYCLGTIGQGMPAAVQSDPIVNFKNSSKVQAYRQILKGDEQNLLVQLISGVPLALCLPNSCSQSSVQIISDKILKKYLNSAISISYDCQDYDDAHPELSTGAIITICFFAVITAIILSSSVYDYYAQLNKIPPKSQLLVAFSAYTNFQKLVKVSSGSAELHCLNGIRVLSMFWVIIGHTMMQPLMEPMTNFLAVFDWANQWHSMFLISGTLSVDTFFVIGGLLVVYIYMKSVHNKVRFNIFMFYIHRYLRLTPALAASVLLNATLLQYFGSGPLWKGIMPNRVTGCKESWWGSLLYLQTYIDIDKMCLGESWYLNVDMQLYFISPVFLLILSRWKKIGVSLLGLGVIAFMIVPFVLTWHFELAALISDLTRNSLDFNKKYYLMTHARAAPWFIGAVAGYFIAEIKFKGKKIKINKYLNAAIWLVVFVLMFVVVLAGHDTLRDEEYDKWGCALYNTFIRPTWGLCIVWIIFACITGNGGIVNWILSQPIFQVLNRFTYSMYLIHLTIVYVVVFSQKTGVYFSMVTVCLSFWGICMFSFFISIYWVLAFESPIIIIEKVLFGKL